MFVSWVFRGFLWVSMGFRVGGSPLFIHGF